MSDQSEDSIIYKIQDLKPKDSIELKEQYKKMIKLLQDKIQQMESFI